MEKSIFELISENITEGVLKEGFSLPEESDYAIQFAPGALDGIYIYHMPHNYLNDEDFTQMAEAVNSAAEGNAQKAEQLFSEFTKEHRAISVIDELQGYIIDHRTELSAASLHSAAVHMILESSHIECVKIGLSLLELFGEPAEGLKEVMRILGLCDEFTIFSVWNMKKWNNGNYEIFELAEKVNGWGRIHAVDQLEPETEEIRHWLLTEGAVNDAAYAYSALTCWNKSDAEDVLFSHPSEDEYKGILTMIEGLLDEGPCQGISALENAENALLRVLDLAPAYRLSAEEYTLILSIKQWADEEDISAVSDACEDILHSEACTDTVKASVKEGKALSLAAELDIPYQDDLLSCMSNDFENCYSSCRWLMFDDAYVEPVLDLFRKKLPLSEMKGEPVDDPCLGEEYRQYNILQFIIQELDSRIMTGTDFVKAGLESPVTRNRYRSLSVLQSWAKNSGKSLAELSDNLYESVKDLQNREINDGNREIIEALLK